MASSRKTLAHFLAFIGFVASYSGAMRAIHLSDIQGGYDPCACHARQEAAGSDSRRDAPNHAPQHNSEECAVCQQLTVGAKTVVADGPTPLNFVGLADRHVAPALTAPVSRARHETFAPRAPPYV